MHPWLVLWHHGPFHPSRLTHRTYHRFHHHQLRMQFNLQSPGLLFLLQSHLQIPFHRHLHCCKLFSLICSDHHSFLSCPSSCLAKMEDQKLSAVRHLAWNHLVSRKQTRYGYHVAHLLLPLFSNSPASPASTGVSSCPSDFGHRHRLHGFYPSWAYRSPF